jgi:hypothetical protein
MPELDRANLLAIAILGATLVVPRTALAQGVGATLESVGWLVSDSAARTARLDLVVTRPAGAPSALINGQRAGGVQVVVPLGWTVTWEWQSLDSAAAHSLVVMAEREKLPTEGGRPAFANGMTRSLADGLAAGQRDQTTFVAEEAGWYWLLCGVPGHALEGEYIGLRIDPDAKMAGIKLRK